MRDLYWFVGAAGIVANFVSGCSSSSKAPFDPGDSGQDATAMPGADAGADANCFFDADLSVVNQIDAAGADCLVCLANMCQPAIRQCESDCLCGYYFACVAYLSADAGVTAFTTCAGSKAAELASNPALSALITCDTTICKSVCVPADAGAADAGGGG